MSSSPLAAAPTEGLEGAVTTSAPETLTGQHLFRTAVEAWGLVSTALADSFSGGRAESAPVGVSEVLDGPPSAAGSEGSSKGTAPRPFSPGPPPPDSSLTPTSGVGTTGVGSSASTQLLLCILVSTAILLRRDGKLSWILFLLPKPRSALRPALERPG